MLQLVEKSYIFNLMISYNEFKLRQNSSNCY